MVQSKKSSFNRFNNKKLTDLPNFVTMEQEYFIDLAMVLGEIRLFGCWKKIISRQTLIEFVICISHYKPEIPSLDKTKKRPITGSIKDEV